MAITVISGLHRGSYVMHVPQFGITVREPLRKHARRLAARGLLVGGVDTENAIRDLESLEIGAVEISGFFKKLAKGVKKGLKKTVNVAKKVAKNKITKSLYNAVKTAAPSPYKEFITAGEVAARVGADVAKGLKKAKKTVNVAKKLATGKTTLAAVKKRAKKLGIKPNEVRDVAATMKLASSNNPEAQKTLAAIREIEATSAAMAPKAYRVKGPSGRSYTVQVTAA